MTDTILCAICQTPLNGPKTLWEYKGVPFWFCSACGSLPPAERDRQIRPLLRQIDEQRAAEAAGAIKYRVDIREDQVESLIVHAFIDLIQERKAAGKQVLAATMETIAAWLSDRTTLPIKANHIQYLTLALRDGLIISVGGGGIGRPNTYDTREAEMGLDAFWDQVEAFLQVWRMPNRRTLLQVSAS